jgi:signal transduction histidine kinase
MEPPIELALAGALDPYVSPFERTATRGALALLISATVIGVVITLLTRRMTREVEHELAQRESLAAVGEFASELAHEVRNPLTAMRLDLQRVEEVAADTEAVRAIVPRVLRQIDRLDRAVTGALRVARGGSMESHRVDLREVLEAARRTAEPEFKQRNAQVRIESGDGAVLSVDGDAGALEQLFLNLLINAAHALSPSGEARVEASRRNGSVEVTIVDTGAGMTPAQLEDIERPFRSSRRSGTGLGLKIARRIVASHHGEIEMTSRAGVGTTVRITLPAG